MPTILIVDDEQIQQEITFRFLQPLPDVHALFAESGEDALSQIKNQPPDLVLTDLRMPGMNGLDLVRKITEDYPHLPVILMTSYGSERLAVRALMIGAASYVPKTDLAQSLADTVEQVLTVAQARRRRALIFKCIKSSETRLDLDNDPELIPPLVGFFQNNLQRLGFGDESTRTRIGMALMEAGSNAMLHGNLEVSSELRKDSQADYLALVEERRRQEPYCSRRLYITAREIPDQTTYTVEDAGPGFNPESLSDPTTPENVLRLSGRGLLLIRTFMDTVKFNERGNQITMIKNRSPVGLD
jgi:CheY-like chemotaxis protein/anti-sigma regulatory factor (Ser/Thr protein kinase)